MSVGHALVLGGTKGLGRVVVERFLARGFQTTVVSRNPPASPLAAHVGHVAADLETMDSAAAEALLAEAVALGGPLSYLVFCQRYRGAGDVWAGEIQVGLTATKAVIEAAKPHFLPDADAAVGIVSSVYAEFVGGSQPVGYHVVKAGLNQMMRYYAWELGRQGVRVNAIMPLSYIKPESREYYAGKPEYTGLYERFVPMKRMGKAEDSADLVDFLCSEKAAFINGQAIFVDGGVSVVWQEEIAQSLTAGR